MEAPFAVKLDLDGAHELVMLVNWFALANSQDAESFWNHQVPLKFGIYRAIKKFRLVPFGV